MEGGAPNASSTTQTMANISELAVDSEYIIPSSLAQIAPILRVANEIELDSPRVAYLCRVYAFEKAHRFDPTCSGGGVRFFKTALLQRLERDAEPSFHSRRKESDAIEMLTFYEQHYENFVKALDNAAKQADGAQMAKAYQTTAILFELLKQFTPSKLADVAPEIIEADKDFEKKTELYLPFNILSLDPAGAHQAIMQLPEEMDA